jgi:NAD(P)-dependent dehydrogenase (short-subunit alcohol dehydrogenase family)
MTGVSDEAAELLTTPPDLRLDGKVAWITGASRGLGRALAFGFAGAGAKVLLSARSADALESVAATIRDAGKEVIVSVGSVSEKADVEAAAALAREEWGQIDVLVNNAGISPSFRRSESVPEEEWRQVIDINLTGPFLCAQAAYGAMPEAGGSIVNISSIHANAGHERLVAYSASKGGMEMLTKTLAVEWAKRGVRVNGVAPGYLETDMTTGLREHEKWSASLLAKIPMGRFGRTSEIVGASLFLASDASRYITGATLFADGGWNAG